MLFLDAANKQNIYRTLTDGCTKQNKIPGKHNNVAMSAMRKKKNIPRLSQDLLVLTKIYVSCL